MSNIIVRLAAAVLLVSTTCGTPSPTPAPLPAGADPGAPALEDLAGLASAGTPTDMVCARLDVLFERLRASPDAGAMSRVYEPYASAGPPEHAYVLEVGSIRVPVPVRAYAISISREPYRGGSATGLFLKADDVFVSVGRGVADEPMTDVFGMAGDAPPGEATPATLALFGRAPTAFEMAREGYSLRLSDYRCDEASRDEAIKLAMLMILKGIAEPAGGTHVYRDVGTGGSVLTVTALPDGATSTRLVLPDTDGGTWDVSWHATTPEALAEVASLPALVSADPPGTAGDPLPEPLDLAARVTRGDLEAAGRLLDLPDAGLLDTGERALREMLGRPE